MSLIAGLFKNLTYELGFTLRNSFIVTKYEIKRYLTLNRILILVVLCLVPTILYISYAGQTAALEIHLHAEGYTWFVGHVLQIFVMFAYIVNILVTIVVIQELFQNESALETLLVSTKRFELFAGKIVTALIIVLLTSIFTWIGCVLAFITWQQELPVTIEQFLLGLNLVMIVSLVPLAITTLGNIFVMKFRSLGGMGTGIPIFVFFILPFFIFSSLYLGFVNDQMLTFSTFFRVYYITDFFFMPEGERFAAIIDINNAFTFFGGLVIVSFLLAWICFWRMEINH